MPERPDKLVDELEPERLEHLQWIMNEFSVEILTAIYWRLEAPWSLPSRRVNDSFFIFPVRGVISVICEGVRHDVAPGDFIMLKDNVVHVVEMGPDAAPIEMIAIHCYIANAWKTPLLNFFANLRGQLRDGDVFLNELRAFVGAFNNNREFGASWGAAILKNLLAREALGGAEILPRTRQFDQRVGKALLRVHDFFAQELSVEKLAVESRLSVAQFRKLFNQHVGMGPKEYIVQHRLKAAKRLLRETQMPLKQIAEEVGFQNVQYFHAVFKGHFSQTPSEFRHRLRAM